MIHQTEIERILKGLPGSIGFYYACPDTGDEYAYYADQPFEAASVIKIPIMVEAFRQMESGLLDRNRMVAIRSEDKLPSCGALTYMHDGLQVTVMDLVTLMIILSDNTATNILIDLLGADNVNRTMRNERLSGSIVNRKLFQPELSAKGIQNYVTARDMATLLKKMMDGTLISASASREMLEILGNQRLNGKIPFFLHPQGIEVSHKTGEDDGITHDVGVIWTEKPQIMCFLSYETDTPVAQRAMQDIARMLAEQ